MVTSPMIRLHAFEAKSRANGPGMRAVVWFQGCTLACRGCFNPATRDPAAGKLRDVVRLAGEISGIPGINGVSISGGEPFQQGEALAELVCQLRKTALGILVFSGFTLEEIHAMPLGKNILGSIDAVVAGPYVESLRCGHGLLGSANQKLHLLTNRYQVGDFSNLPRSEVIIHRDGCITVTGIGPVRMSGANRSRERIVRNDESHVIVT